MFKKIILVILSVMILFSTFVVSSAANMGDISNREVNEIQAIENHVKILEYYQKNNFRNFAGTYIDEEGYLNVNLVGNQAVESNDEKSLKNILGASNVKFHNVTYSINDLDGAIASLNKIMVDQDISMIERDDQSNKVYVYLKDVNGTKINDIKKIIDSPFIEFRESSAEITLTASNITNGAAFSTTSGTATIGLGARKSDGTIGYIIPGHVPDAVGTSVRYGSDVIGTISQKVFGGGTDAAFVTKSGTSWQPSKKLNGTTLINSLYTQDEYTSVNTMSSYAQNMTIYKWGQRSGKTVGKILSNNFSYTVNGVAFTNMVKADYIAIEGDSGAPVGYQNSTSSNQNKYTIIGTQSASALDSSGNWGSGSYSIFSKILNVLSSLNNCTPYPS